MSAPEDTRADGEEDRRSLALVSAFPSQIEMQVDPFWPQPLPRDPETDLYWVTGDVAGTAFDSQGCLYTINRRNLTEFELGNVTPAPALIVYDEAGAVVRSANPPNLPQGGHGCFVDYEDNLWIAGASDGIVQKYSHDLSALLLQIGENGRCDTHDQTRQGQALNRSKELLDGPADVAIDPSNGEIYIADGYGNRRVVVFDKDGNFLRQWGEQASLADVEEGAGGKFFDAVHAVHLRPDGLVYVNDRAGNRIQVFEKDGSFVRNIWINRGHRLHEPKRFGTSWDMAFWDEDGRSLIHVPDGDAELIWTLDLETGEALGAHGHPGHMAGQFTTLHSIDIDAHGNLSAAETINGRRVQRIVVKYRT